jgi:membrane protein DedA with SNARE-associated domain
MFTPIINWYYAVLDQWGYWVIALLMAAESTVLPIPSEVIIPPAAYKAWSGTGLELFGNRYFGWSAEIMLVIVGALGSWVGAAAMYWVARIAGRPFVLAYGKYFLISPAKVEGAERWTSHYGPFGIFASRLLPVIRHLIGIPAGIVRMNFWKYSLYTLVGAAMWTAVLAWLGVKVGGKIADGKMPIVYVYLISFLLIVGAVYYLFVHRHMSKTSEKPVTVL